MSELTEPLVTCDPEDFCVTFKQGDRSTVPSRRVTCKHRIVCFFYVLSVICFQYCCLGYHIYMYSKLTKVSMSSSPVCASRRCFKCYLNMAVVWGHRGEMGLFPAHPQGNVSAHVVSEWLVAFLVPTHAEVTQGARVAQL